MELHWSDSDCPEHLPLRFDRRFRLRTAWLLLSLLCALLAAIGAYVRWNVTQESAFAEIARRGGTIFVDGNRVWITFQDVPAEATEQRCRCRVIHAHDKSKEFTDRDLPLLAAVSGLSTVELAGSDVTNIGLVRLRGLVPTCRAERNGSYPWERFWSTWGRC